jgi:hypothetical protein
MQWIEADNVDWCKLFDENQTIVIVLRRNEVNDVVCGRLSMIDNRSGLEIESLHQGQFAFHNYEVEKVLLLGKEW